MSSRADRELRKACRERNRQGYDFEIDMDALWGDCRYLLYRLDDDGTPVRIAGADSPQGVGLALVTIAEEEQDASPVGVLDAHARRWLVGLWSSRRSLPFH